MNRQNEPTPYGSVRERATETTPTRTSQYLTRNTPPSGQDSQSRFNLYSEIEKLTVINLDLKKQNENLIRELEKQSFLISKIPELEAKIIDQEKEMARKETNFASTLRDQEFLRKDLSNLQKLEPAYNELFAHNKRLLSEIDDLNNQLERSIHDKERLEADLVSTHAKLNEALKRNDNANLDLDEQKKEIYNIRDQNKLLNDKLRGAGFENERLQNLFNDAQREITYLKQRLAELEKGHADQVVNLSEKIENEKQSNYEITSKFISEKNHLETDLKHAHGRIDELQHKLNVLVSENDKLHKLNLDANSEIESLNQKLYENQRRHIEDHEKLEKDRRNQLDSQGKELTLEIIKQRQQYEDRIGALKSEILELQKLHDVIHEKEKEIEGLKLQNNYNEKNWERKLQNAVESERSNNNARFGVERGELQNEINSRGLRINELERKITSLTNEIERLSVAHQEREKEIREQRNNLIQNDRESRLAFDDLKNTLNAEKRQELDDLEMGLRRVYEAQLDLLKDRIADLEDKVARLSDDNARLALSNDEKQSEIDLHKYRIHVQEQKHSNYAQDMERIHNDKLRAAIERERSNTQADCNIELTKYETKIAEQDKEIVKNEQKIRMLDAEIDRLGTQLAHKIEELNHEKRRVVDLDTQKAQELALLNQNFDLIKQATLELATATSKLEAEKLLLNTQLKQQRERIEQLEKRLALLIEENEKLRAVYNEKVENLEDLRKSYIEAQGNTEKEKNALLAEIDNLRFARLEIQEITIKHSAEKAQYENHIRQLKTLCDNNKDELDKLYDVLQGRKKELDELTKNYDDLRAKFNNLSAENRETGAENSNQKDINDKLTKKAELLEKERNLYLAKNEELNTDLNKTNDELRQKLVDLDNLKKKYDESMKLSTDLSSQLMMKLSKLH